MNKSLGIYNLIDEENIKNSIKNVIYSGIDFNTYSTPKGLKVLREEISIFLKNTQNINVDSSNILITTGSQQSLNLLAKAFLKDNDIIVEQPTYFGALDIFSTEKANMIGINITETGIDINELENIISKHNPKLIYVTPTFNNPTGFAWNNKNRMEFLKIVNKHNIMVIEDDPYSLLNFAKTKYKSLYQLNDGKNIVYLGTFSKLISPSINVGYILADREKLNKLYPIKKNFDLNTNTFVQYIVLDYLKNNDLCQIVNQKILKYKQLLKKSLTDLKRKYKNDIEYITKAKGGLFYLVKFKNQVNYEEFENANIYFLDKNNDKFARINICSFVD